MCHGIHVVSCPRSSTNPEFAWVISGTSLRWDWDMEEKTEIVSEAWVIPVPSS